MKLKKNDGIPCKIDIYSIFKMTSISRISSFYILNVSSVLICNHQNLLHYEKIPGLHSIYTPHCAMWLFHSNSDLTHLFLDKMAAIFQTVFSDVFSWMKGLVSLWKIHWGLFDSITAFVYIMTWGRIGDKPLSEPMLTRFTDAYMRR